MFKIIMSIIPFTLMACGSSVVNLGENKFQVKCQKVFYGICEDEAKKQCGEKGYEEISSEIKNEYVVHYEGATAVRDFKPFKYMVFKCRNISN